MKLIFVSMKGYFYKLSNFKCTIIYVDEVLMSYYLMRFKRQIMGTASKNYFLNKRIPHAKSFYDCFKPHYLM